MRLYVYTSAVIILALLLQIPSSLAADPGDTPPPSLDLSEREMAKFGRNAAHFWSYGLELAADASSPFKEKQYTDATGGVGYEMNLLKTIVDNIAVRFTYGKSGLHEDGDFNNYSPETPPIRFGLQVTSIRTELDINRYFVSLQYNAYPLNLKFTTARFYFYGGLGLVNHKTTVHETISNTLDSTVTTYIDHDSINKIANTLGAGVVLMFTRYTGLDLSIGFDLVHAGEHSMVLPSSAGGHYRAYNYGGTTNIKLGLIALL